MYPTLFHAGQLSLHTYGIAIAVGFLVGILLLVHSGRRQGISVERLLDLAFWILVSSLLGSRLLFIITDAKTTYGRCVGLDQSGSRSVGQILFDCTRSLHLWEGGLVYYGGLISALFVSLWYTRRHKMNFYRVADLAIPFVALGHFFGRLGCFFAGCCYGKVTRAAWGLSFPPASMIYHEMVQYGLLSAAAKATPPVYPTQLFEAVAELGIFFLLLAINQHKRYHGQGLLIYLVTYPIVRFLLEMLRADPDRRYLISLDTPGLNRLLGLPQGSPALLSTSQLISLLCLIVAVVLLWHLRRASRFPRAGKD